MWRLGGRIPKQSSSLSLSRLIIGCSESNSVWEDAAWEEWDLFCNNCFIKVKYSSSVFAEARRGWAWDLWARKVWTRPYWGLALLLSHFLTIVLEILFGTWNESHHLALNLLLRIGTMSCWLYSKHHVHTQGRKNLEHNKKRGEIFFFIILRVCNNYKISSNFVIFWG